MTVVALLLIGGSLWLDFRSDVVVATVSGKMERVGLGRTPQGSWTRNYRVGVTFESAPDGSATATVEVPEERFDRLEPGDTISIRYLAAIPLVARPADASTLTLLRSLLHRVVKEGVVVRVLLWSAAGIVLLWIASHVATAAIGLAGLLWIAAAVPLLFPARAPVTLPPAATEARIEAISLVDRVPQRSITGRRYRTRTGFDRRLEIPYQVVQFRVAGPARAHSMLAVDAVDSGSVRGLVVGAALPARYDPTAPRHARLVGASREFAHRNRFHLLTPVAGICLLAMLGAWGLRTRRLRRAGP